MFSYSFAQRCSQSSSYLSFLPRSAPVDYNLRAIRSWSRGQHIRHSPQRTPWQPLIYGVQHAIHLGDQIRATYMPHSGDLRRPTGAHCHHLSSAKSLHEALTYCLLNTANILRLITLSISAVQSQIFRRCERSPKPHHLVAFKLSAAQTSQTTRHTPRISKNCIIRNVADHARASTETRRLGPLPKVVCLSKYPIW
jgi:hypothetical protein